jgi:hypothetical protein
MKRITKVRAAFVVTVATSALLGCSTDGPMSTFTRAPCSTLPPLPGSTCTVPNGTLCDYSVECPGNFPGSFGRRCTSGVWTEVPGAPCNPPPDGGIALSDAGAGTGVEGGASGDASPAGNDGG